MLAGTRALVRRRLSPRHPLLGACGNGCGTLTRPRSTVDKGDYARAEERLNLAIKEIRPYLPDTRRIMARSYCELAKVLYHQKRYTDAEPLARWALSVRESDKKSKPDAVFQCGLHVSR